jgi:hypothetical protein
MIVKSCVPAEGLGDGRETAADKVSAAEEGGPQGGTPTHQLEFMNRSGSPACFFPPTISRLVHCGLRRGRTDGRCKCSSPRGVNPEDHRVLSRAVATVFARTRISKLADSHDAAGLGRSASPGAGRITCSACGKALEAAGLRK